MAIESLNILTSDEGKAMLAEVFAGVIDNVQKSLISAPYKNMDLSGDPEAGTMFAKRFANAESQDYGTARAAGKGNAVHDLDVKIDIDQDKEFVEEIEAKDIKLYPVKDVLQRRGANQVARMQAVLDRAFFSAAAEEATTVTPTTSTIPEILEELIQTLENLENDYVDGVERSFMGLVLSTAAYGTIRNELDTQTRSNVDTAAEEFLTWHGVEVKSCTHLPSDTDALLMVKGSVAQPVFATPYEAEKIPLSEAYAVEMFYHYGTKVIAPDLIFKISNL